MKKIISLILLMLCILSLSGCNEASTIKQNISNQSDNFETYRKITVINLRSDKVLLEVEGYLSIKDSTETELAIIIQTGKNQYKMHYVYTGAEIVYLVEQLDPSHTDPYHWEIRIFAIVPDIDLGRN